MLMMTPAAGGYLCDVLERAQAPQETAIRLEIEGNTLKSKLDQARPGDATYDHEGRPVLLLDDRVAQLLEGSTLDLEPTSQGGALILLH
ncbi:MAG TPA: hypothetical protein VML57_11185 [Burkholderiales bacterium]|jgi:hypothetical protein|nr:hypothetical protein [Burkholderiales bacterium]